MAVPDTDNGNNRGMLTAVTVMQAATFFVLAYTVFLLLIEWIKLAKTIVPLNLSKSVKTIGTATQVFVFAVAAISIWGIIWKLGTDKDHLDASTTMLSVATYSFTVFTAIVIVAVLVFTVKASETAFSKPITLLAATTPFIAIRTLYAVVGLVFRHDDAFSHKYAEEWVIFVFAFVPELLILVIFAVPGAVAWFDVPEEHDAVGQMEEGELVEKKKKGGWLGWLRG
ncbi:hypothetical protein HDV00_007325 [Rhizophlyctis rosea]|nr:hypothetical protein HDV00_007325 [Rhizophlyctis rosea]